MRFYSQNGEDCLLWALFDAPGFYVDVGAFDGVHLSNSLSFEEQGWDGICVEAHPEMFELCRRARNATCVQAACVGDPALKSVSFQIEKLGLLSGQAVDEADLRLRYKRRGLPYEGIKTITVPAVTLTNLLEGTSRDVDFISIDVEGTEMDVLHGLDLRMYRPRALVVEANHRAEGTRMQRYLRRFGYRLARTIRQNLFFTASRSDARKLRGPIECFIEPNLHPLGLRYTLPEARERRSVRIPADSRLR
jgi:FkbM family methyltransferase